MLVDPKHGWKKTTIRPLLANYIGGGWGSDAIGGDFSEPGAVIRGTDIPNASVGLTTGIPLRFHKRSNIRTRKLAPDDIIFEVSGGSKDQLVGRALFCSEKLLAKLGADVIPASFCKRLMVNQERASPRFLYYFLRQIYQDRRILQWQVQSTGISNFQFEAFLDECELLLPAIAQQEHIASILSAYDDLIENNTRRIAILEEMARRIYEEWFVRFRFPGHQNVRMVESELGLVPEGWETHEVKDVVRRLPAGRVYKQAEVFSAGAVPVVDQSTAELLGFHDDEPAHCASPDAPVVIFGDHTCKMQLMVAPFSVGPNTVPFIASELPVQYVYALVRGLVTTHEYKRHWSDLMKRSVVSAPASLASQFADCVRPLSQLDEVLRRKNRSLRETRDLLLPKLISGELEVSAMPHPESAAA